MNSTSSTSFTEAASSSRVKWVAYFVAGHGVDARATRLPGQYDSAHEAADAAEAEIHLHPHATSYGSCRLVLH